MRSSKLLAAVPGELARLSSAYETEARSHAGLAPHPTLPRLLEHLVPTGKRSTEPRKALISTLLAIHQTRPHRVWSTVLLYVFTPLLKRLRKCLQGGDPETRDEILLEEFQQAIARVRTGDPARIFMYVRQEVRQRTFKALEDVTAWDDVGFGTDADLEPDPRTVDEPQLLGVWLKGFGTRPEQAELLATFMDHGGLEALARRRSLSGAADSRRTYRRLQKTRQRLAAELRNQFEVNART